MQVDLGKVCELANIQTSWYICKGSEGYYTYTVEGSLDGQNWTKLLDHTNKNSEEVTKTYGFNSDMLSGKARYVRLNVQNATLQNNPTNNWYTPTVYEVRVFGTPVGEAVKPEPYLDIDFEDGTGLLALNGGASVKQDAEKGKVLYLDGTDDSYGAFPSGMLDGLHDYTVSMDIKSESEGNFFTFAAGRDDQKYVFFRVAEDVFRFAATTDSWRDETELIYDLDGTKWHNYTLVVSGADTKLYLDGKEVCHTTETHGQLADMGSGTSCFIGKSYYADDTCFKGSIDNIRIYKSALTASEIGGTSEVRGDVNADGEFNIADVVTLQNWLLQKSGTQLKNWKAADLCTDGKLNVFDLVLLKRSYFNNRKW